MLKTSLKSKGFEHTLSAHFTADKKKNKKKKLSSHSLLRVSAFPPSLQLMSGTLQLHFLHQLFRYLLHEVRRTKREKLNHTSNLAEAPSGRAWTTLCLRHIGKEDNPSLLTASRYRILDQQWNTKDTFECPQHFLLFISGSNLDQCRSFQKHIPNCVQNLHNTFSFWDIS